jgi:sulfide:quinone oxidoreductase
MHKKVLVLGGNFGGLTAALSVKHELDEDADVTVVSASDTFLFNPSLIWLPFGKRTAEDITFPLGPTFEAHGVDFVHATATRIDPVARRVETTSGSHGYDYLVIATGYRNQMDVIPGLDAGNSAYTITTLEEAANAGAGWRRFLDDPGPIVIGATQGAGCFGAAYEFLFNASYQLRKAGLHKRVPLTYVTAEPFLGHFGIRRPAWRGETAPAGGLLHRSRWVDQSRPYAVGGQLGSQRQASRRGTYHKHIDRLRVTVSP